MKNERVDLAAHDTIGATDLTHRIPSDQARYHLFRYKHTHEGDYMESIRECVVVYRGFDTFVL